MNLFKNELRPFMSVCVVCVGGRGGGGIRWWTFFIFLFIYSGIFENVIAKWTFRVQQFLFFGQKLSPRVPPLFFFLFSSFPFPRYFFFSFPFPMLLWFWRSSELKNLSFEAFSFKWLQIWLNWFSKNRLDMYIKKNIQLVITVFKQHHAYGCLFNSVGGRASETTLEAVKIIFHT